MPRFLVPKISQQHRTAAIALYRALLSRCSTVPIHDEVRAQLCNAIRNKFRKNKRLESPRQLGIVFRAGYETLDHIDAAAAGETKAIEFLNSLISSIPRGLVRYRHTLPSPLKQASEPPPTSPSSIEAFLDARPYPNLTGPRHVPILASANGIPFLRIKKPQPQSLSTALRHKLAKRKQRFGMKITLSNYWIPIGQYEDGWDRMLEKNLGFTDKDDKETSWVHEMKQALMTNEKESQDETRRERHIASKMIALIDQETKLAIEEGQTVIRGRKNKPIRSRFLK